LAQLRYDASKLCIGNLLISTRELTSAADMAVKHA
jgi:hypothetical protein